jgi:hypothetical protein
MESKTYTFIQKAKEVHGDKYDYSLVNYLTNKTKVTITCPIHGEFNQTPNSHLKGDGCPKCGLINRGNSKTKTLSQFISEAKEIHGDKYDYSKTIYTKLKSNVIIICPIHGEFEQTPKSHLRGAGCRKCGRQICGDKSRLTTESFIEKANKTHNNFYDYSKTVYINSRTKVQIICPVHGLFEQNAKHHSLGIGCPLCKESKGEKEVREYLEQNNIKFIPQYKFADCKNIKPLPFDFYLPDHNTCIEYNGKQHYILNEFFGEDSFKLTQKNDKIKMGYCQNNNIPLIVIKYDENVFERLNEAHF